MAFELPDGKTARNIQEQVAFLTAKLKELIAFVNQAGLKSIQIVEELPEVGDPTILYFLEKEDPDTGDYYDEYLWIDEAWELIGSTQIDLSDYCTLSTDQTITGEKTFNKDVYIVDTTQGTSYELKLQNNVNTTRIRANGYTTDINTHFNPRNNNVSSLGGSGIAWKDLYLGGTAYIGSQMSVDSSANASILDIKRNGTIEYRFGTATFMPNTNNTFDLGTSSYAWKDLYLSGSIVLAPDSAIKVGTATSVIFKAYTFQTYSFSPLANDSYDIGTASRCYQTLYSINISDGTNSSTVENLVKKARLYKHTITTSGGQTLNVITTVSTAYTTFEPAMFDNAVIFKVGEKTALSYNYGGGQMTNIYYVEYNGTLTNIDLTGQTLTTDVITDL